MISFRQILSPRFLSRNLLTTTRRLYSVEAQSVKPNLSLVSRLRKETQCSLSKAREALVAAQNDYSAALTWLNNEIMVSGEKKALKLESRVAKEGVVAVAGGSSGFGDSSLLTGRAVMVEVNCETDFVAKSDLFVNGVRDIVWTVYMLADKVLPKDMSSVANPKGGNTIVSVAVEDVMGLPVIPAPGDHAVVVDGIKTVKDVLMECIAKSGENIQLRRIVAVVPPDAAKAHCKSCQDPVAEACSPDATPCVVVSGAYVHGSNGLPKGFGRIGSLVAMKLKTNKSGAFEKQELKSELPLKARQLAQHVVGMSPAALQGESDDCLLNQEYLFGDGRVEDFVQALGTERGVALHVDAFERFAVGEQN